MIKYLLFEFVLQVKNVYYTIVDYFVFKRIDSLVPLTLIYHTVIVRYKTALKSPFSHFFHPD